MKKLFSTDALLEIENQSYSLMCHLEYNHHASIGLMPRNWLTQNRIHVLCVSSFGLAYFSLFFYFVCLLVLLFLLVMLCLGRWGEYEFGG